MRNGKPFQWTEQVEDEILGRIANGESIMDILNDDRDEWLPGSTTFYRRLMNDADWWAKYARAREAQAHYEVEEIRKIADNATPEDHMVARLRIDARKWRASKMAPKHYSERALVEMSGPEGGPIQTVDATALVKARLDAIASRTTGEASEG